MITTKDLGALLRDRGVDFASLPDEEFDEFMGAGSGAAALFGSTGGVMEAALRWVGGRGRGCGAGMMVGIVRKRGRRGSATKTVAGGVAGNVLLPLSFTHAECGGPARKRRVASPQCLAVGQGWHWLGQLHSLPLLSSPSSALHPPLLPACLPACLPAGRCTTW